MIPISADEQNETDDESDPQADAMKDQLRKDVASWSAARAGSSGETPDMASRSATHAAKQPPAARVAKQKAKPAKVTVAVPEEKKPFRMSYDGTTDRDYIAQRIKLGAR
jgi:hypothetical protein